MVRILILTIFFYILEHLIILIIKIYIIFFKIESRMFFLNDMMIFNIISIYIILCRFFYYII